MEVAASSGSVPSVGGAGGPANTAGDTASRTPPASGGDKSQPSKTPSTAAAGGADKTPPAAPPEKKDEAPAKKKYKMKVNGKETEVELSEQELIEGYQTRQASDEKFREASMSKKQAEEFIHLLRTDPMKVLRNPALSINMRELAEQYLVGELEEELLDPKDKELRDHKKKLQAFEDEKKAAEKEQQEKRVAALREKYSQDYSTQIVSALQTSGLPKTEHTVKRMAYYMHQGIQRGLDLKAADVVDLVREDYINDHKALHGGLDADMLVQLLGEESINKIRNWDLARLKDTRGAKLPTTPAKQGGNPAVTKKKVGISKEDWKARLERIKNGEE